MAPPTSPTKSPPYGPQPLLVNGDFEWPLNVAPFENFGWSWIATPSKKTRRAFFTVAFLIKQSVCWAKQSKQLSNSSYHKAVIGPPTVCCVHGNNVMVNGVLGPCIDQRDHSYKLAVVPQGTYFIDMNGDTPGTLFQNISLSRNGLVPGQPLIISAWIAGNWDCFSCFAQSRYTEFLVDNVPVGTMGISAMP
jgi:hypothetical protein